MATSLTQYKARIARYEERQALGASVHPNLWTSNPGHVRGVRDRLEESLARYPDVDQARLAVGKLILDKCLDAGTSYSFALAAAHHAYFESRWTHDAVNPGPGTPAQKAKARAAGKAYAIGIFQLTQSGIGGSRPYFEGGKRAGTALQATKDPDHYYDATVAETCLQAWLSAVLAKQSKVAKDYHLTPHEAYEKLFWSSLGAGRRNATLEAQLHA